MTTPDDYKYFQQFFADAPMIRTVEQFDEFLAHAATVVPDADYGPPRAVLNLPSNSPVTIDVTSGETHSVEVAVVGATRLTAAGRIFVHAYMQAQITATQNVAVTATHDTRVVAHDCEVIASGNTQIRASGDSEVSVFDPSPPGERVRIVLNDRATAWLHHPATVHQASDNAVIRTVPALDGPIPPSPMSSSNPTPGM